MTPTKTKKKQTALDALDTPLDTLEAAPAATPSPTPSTPAPSTAASSVLAPDTDTGLAVTSVEATVKGAVSVALGRATAVVGRSRVGKTAVLDALRLGLLGKHPVGPHATDLMELAAPGRDTVAVRLATQNGTAHFVVEGKRKPPEQPTFAGDLRVLEDPAVRERAMPATSMRSFLVGDKLAREAVVARFGASASLTLTPPPGLTPEQEAVWTSYVEAAAPATPSKQLSELVGTFRRAKLAHGKQANALEDEHTALSTRLEAVAAGQERLPALETEYEQATIYESLTWTRSELDRVNDSLTRYEQEAAEFLASASVVASVETAVQGTEQRVQQFVESRRPMLEDLTLTKEAAEARLGRVRAICDVLSAMTQANVHECPVCHTAGQDPVQLLAELTEVKAKREAEVAACQRACLDVTAEVTKETTALATLKNELAVTLAARERRRAQIKTEAAAALAQRETLEKTLSEALFLGEPPKRGAQVVRAEIETIRRDSALRSEAEALKVKVRQTRETQEVLKLLEGEAENALKTLLESVRGHAETTVNRYMPAGYQAMLDLSDGGCEWRVVGADGRPHNRHAMSGSERASLMVALALAWTEGAPIRILTLDDEDVGPFHVDPAALTQFLARLKEVVDIGLLTQVVVAGLREEEVPAGWSKVVR